MSPPADEITTPRLTQGERDRLLVTTARDVAELRTVLLGDPPGSTTAPGLVVRMATAETGLAALKADRDQDWIERVCKYPQELGRAKIPVLGMRVDAFLVVAAALTAITLLGVSTTDLFPAWMVPHVSFGAAGDAAAAVTP